MQTLARRQSPSYRPKQQSMLSETRASIVSILDQARAMMSKPDYLKLCSSIEQHCYVEHMEESGAAESLSRESMHGKHCDCRDFRSIMGIPA
jgi:hypothetical protein